MQTKVLLSIKPRFAEKIFAGSKKYEFRRVIFRSKSVSKVIVYASSPIRRIIGEFEVGEILALQKDKLWRKTRGEGGIEKKHFDIYFHGREMAYAIKVSSPRRYSQPVKLSELHSSIHPPQSFRYIH
jgi:predicted transcriptional regulator